MVGKCRVWGSPWEIQRTACFGNTFEANSDGYIVCLKITSKGKKSKEDYTISNWRKLVWRRNQQSVLHQAFERYHLRTSKRKWVNCRHLISVKCRSGSFLNWSRKIDAWRCSIPQKWRNQADHRRPKPLGSEQIQNATDILYVVTLNDRLLSMLYRYHVRSPPNIWKQRNADISWADHTPRTRRRRCYYTRAVIISFREMGYQQRRYTRKYFRRSGYRKSHAVQSVLRCIPDGHILRGRLSDMAMFYHKFPEGTIIVMGDQDMTDVMAEIIKNASSEWGDTITHRTVLHGATQTLTISSNFSNCAASPDIPFSRLFHSTLADSKPFRFNRWPSGIWLRRASSACEPQVFVVDIQPVRETDIFTGFITKLLSRGE